jgi:hypothetical protein
VSLGVAIIVLLLLALVIFAETSVIAQEDVNIVIFVDRDYLIIYVPGNVRVSLQDLAIEVGIDGGHEVKRLDDYGEFQILDWGNVPTPICFRWVRAGTIPPLDDECDPDSTPTRITSASGVFWYDTGANRPRSLLLIRDANPPKPLGYCYTGSVRCNIIYDPPTFTPTAFSTQAPTLTSTPSATPTIVGSVLFADTFDGDLSGWRVDGNWRIIEDENGNHYVCVDPTPDVHSFLSLREGVSWQGYRLELEIMSLDLSQEWGAKIDVHRVTDPVLQAYQFNFFKLQVQLSRRNDNISNDWKWLKNADQSVKPDAWNHVQIEIPLSGVITYSINDSELIRYDDQANFLTEGSIRLGASPNSGVCFDNIRITALP